MIAFFRRINTVVVVAFLGPQLCIFIIVPIAKDNPKDFIHGMFTVLFLNN